MPLNAPIVLITCDGKDPERSAPCGCSTNFVLPSFATTREQAVRLFKATHPDWLIGEKSGTVACPRCVRLWKKAQLEQAAAIAERQSIAR